MRTLSTDEYQKLREGAKVLMADGHGDKVLALADGTFLKLFRTKSRFSSARFFPYAKRFAHNAYALQELGIPTVEIIETFQINPPQRNVVHYKPLEGKSVRDIGKANGNQLSDELAGKLGAFIALLHEQGVYFRSLHFGNVLVLPNGGFGLIDISDMRVNSTRRLTLGKRKRNFAHMLRYHEDMAMISNNGRKLLFAGYLEKCSLTLSQPQRQELWEPIHSA